MKQISKSLVCLALIAVISSAISCTNYEVYNSGNGYKLGEIVVGPNAIAYKSK